MSQIGKGILAASAIALSLGAAQFASGEDLTVGMRTAGIPDQGVNRAAKTDRAPTVTVAEPVAPTRTIAIRVDRFPDISVLVRIPLNHQVRTSAPAQFEPKGERKMAVACEPVVSVLTEIAKRLEPGRCVT